MISCNSCRFLLKVFEYIYEKTQRQPKKSNLNILVATSFFKQEGDTYYRGSDSNLAVLCINHNNPRASNLT